MRIIQATSYFPPHIGGIENHVKELSLSLADKGHDVLVLTTNIPRTKKCEQMGNITVHRFPAINIPYVPIVPNLKKILKRYDADIFHSHCPPPFFSCSMPDGHHIVTYHCDIELPASFSGFCIPNSLRKVVEKKYNEIFVPKIIENCDKVICTGKSYVESSPVLGELKKSDYEVIPNAININNFRNIRNKQRNDGDFIILFVGRLAASKGVDYLIRCVPSISSEFDANAKFVIIGEGEEKKELVRLTKKLGVDKNVFFKGYVPFDQLLHWYSNAIVTVLPSISRLEAFGIVQLESMACETPVIASKLPGVKEIVEDGITGFLVEPGNTEELADAIIRILSDREKAQRMGKEGRKVVERKYTWDVVTDKIIALYKKTSSES